MVERVSQSNSSSARRMDSATSTPREPSGIDTAATDFSSLMNQPSTASSAREREATPQNHANDDHSRQDQSSDSETNQKSSDERDANKGKENTETKAPQSPGEAILQSLKVAEPGVGKTEAAPTQGTDKLGQIVGEIADQLQVADVDGSREVRITLKNSILPGTEVRFSQQAGKMQVQFVTNSSQSQEFLAQHAGALQDGLNQKLPKHDFVVSVEHDAAGFDSQHDGQSKGRQDDQQADEDD